MEYTKPVLHVLGPVHELTLGPDHVGGQPEEPGDRNGGSAPRDEPDTSGWS
jgi:hypothetical protein